MTSPGEAPVREVLRALERRGIRLMEYPPQAVPHAIRGLRALVKDRTTALESDDPHDLHAFAIKFCREIDRHVLVLGAFLDTLETLEQAAGEPIFPDDLQAHADLCRDPAREVQESGVGPVSLDWTLARSIGWDEAQLERTAMILAQLSRRETRIAQHRQGRTAVCPICEQWIPPSGCDLGCEQIALDDSWVEE